MYYVCSIFTASETGPSLYTHKSFKVSVLNVVVVVNANANAPSGSRVCVFANYMCPTTLEPCKLDGYMDILNKSRGQRKLKELF